MASDSSSSTSQPGAGGAGSETNGWPDRNEHSPEWWGRKHFVPQPGHPDRVRMFVQPLKMSEEEEKRILSNYRNLTDKYPATAGMAHHLRPSTPRNVRADRRIAKLKREGVEVDADMGTHIRNVIEGNSGLHEALRHFTQGETNPCIPYLNEFLHREDRMLMEWAKQKKQDYDWYEQKASAYSSNGAPSNGTQKSRSQMASSPARSIRSYDQPRQQSGSEETSSEDHQIHEVDSAGNPIAEVDDRDDLPSQGQSSKWRSPESKSSKASKDNSKRLSEIADARKQAHVEEGLSVLLELLGEIRQADKQIANGLDHVSKLRVLNGEMRRPGADAEASYVESREYLKDLLQKKSQRLRLLAEDRAKASQAAGEVEAPSPQADSQPAPHRRGRRGILGLVRWVWNGCADSAISPTSSQANSRQGSLDRPLDLEEGGGGIAQHA